VPDLLRCPPGGSEAAGTLPGGAQAEETGRPGSETVLSLSSLHDEYVDALTWSHSNVWH
jgi:hypothetical protein